jgi:hypothetical protein
MKLIIALLTMTLSLASFATDFKEGDLGLVASQGKIISVSPICPKVPGQMSCMAIGSKIKIEVALPGCVDRLASYSSKLIVVDDRAVLYFSATSITTEMSTRARCVKMPTATVTVFVDFEGEIVLENIDTVVL